MFELINSATSIGCQLFEPDPDQKCTSAVIALDSCFAALAAFKPGDLAEIDQPELVADRGDLNASDDANPFDNAVGIAVVLTTHQFDLLRIALIQDGIIKADVALHGLDYLRPDILSDQAWREHFAAQETIDRFLRLISQ